MLLLQHYLLFRKYAYVYCARRAQLTTYVNDVAGVDPVVRDIQD